jgi:hypothetical protein
MVTFQLEKEIRAPPRFVVDWWLNYSSDDTPVAPGAVGRRVERLGERSVRLTTDTEFAGRARTTDGTVTRTGPQSWQLAAHVLTDGIVVSTIMTSYSVEPTIDGSRVIADFVYRGQNLMWMFLLTFSRFSLRRDRNRSFDGYVREIEAEFAATKAGTASGPVPPPPALAGPPRA